MLILGISFGCNKNPTITPPPVDPLGLIAIEAGSFMIGSPPAIGYDAKHPQRKVTLSAFIKQYRINQRKI